jgi:hypothetical protein
LSRTELDAGELIAGRMDAAGLLLTGLAAYAAAGLLTAIAFVIFGVVRVLPAPVPVTVGARILLVPGAAALWPYVLGRWVAASRSSNRPGLL